MARIALCWELGAGAGHIAPLAAFAETLGSQDHSLCVFARDQSLLNSFPALSKAHCLQAPFYQGPTVSQPAINYSEIMSRCGFKDAATLKPLLQSWVSQLAEQQVQLIIADHSPGAVLAARVLGLPLILAGNGFSAPLAQTPMPSVLPWAKVTDSQLSEADMKVVAVINAVCEELGYSHARVDNVADLFSASECWLTTTAELDHYVRSDAKYLTPPAPPHGLRQPEWPDVEGDKIFVYFDTQSQHLPNLLNQLLSLGEPVLAVVPGLDAAWVKKLDGSNIRYSAELVNIQAVGEQCRWVICHGGQILSRDFLALGIPCLMLPDVVERTLFAYRAASAGLAFAGTVDPSRVDIAEMMRVAERTPLVWQRAQDFSQRFKRGESTESLGSLLSDKLAELQLN